MKHSISNSDLFANSKKKDTEEMNQFLEKNKEHVFDFGRSLKVDSIELGVSEENTSAIEFYRSLGMTTKSRKMEIILN